MNIDYKCNVTEEGKDLINILVKPISSQKRSFNINSTYKNCLQKK